MRKESIPPLSPHSLATAEHQISRVFSQFHIDQTTLDKEALKQFAARNRPSDEELVALLENPNFCRREPAPKQTRSITWGVGR